MKAKHIFSVLILVTILISSCQSTKGITFKSIEDNLIDFLIKKGDIMEHQVNDYKNGKYKIHLIGIVNGYNANNLINGIYTFSSGFTNTRAYYLIVEENNHTILDLSTRENLETSIKNTLDFCERQKYCSKITEDYVSRLIGVYYSINKYPLTREDPNCLKKTKEVKDLP